MNMIYIRNRILFFIVIALIAFQGFVNADVIVRVEVQEGSASPVYFDARLFEDVAPNTVSNFLNYANGTTVNGGSYNDVFFHRNALLANGTNFIFQTGGFVFNPLNGGFVYDDVNETFPGGLDEVVADNFIVNEFQLPNLSGTLAMAKVAVRYEDASGTPCYPEGANCILVPGTGADSATSQWFINLADNSSNLDSQNGGFTVFGEVMGNGMDVVDVLTANLPVDKSDIHPAFGDLPLVNYAANETVDETKLVKLINIEELISITGDIDFGLQLTSTTSSQTISVSNISAGSINIGTIVFNNLPSLPFSIRSGTNSCGSVLLTGETCSFILDFTPDTDGDFSNSINIDLANLAINYTLSVSGRSAAQIRPIISPSLTVVDYGEVGVVLDPSSAVPDQLVVLVNNEGNADLNITSATLSGDDVSFFQVFDNCKIVTPVAPGDQCVLPINLFALETGVKNAILTILSDDPDQPSLVIPIKAIVSDDVDGVDSAIEDQSSLLGDGNFDGIPDRHQSNVVSLKADKDQNITLVTESFIEYSEVIVNDAASLVSIPNNVNFDLGAIQFRVNDPFSLGSFDVGFILPATVNVDAIYFYGSTAGDSSEQWHIFDHDGKAGVKLITNASFVTQDGNTVERKIIWLSLEDGGRGDTDMLENGEIKTLFAISVPDSESSGAVNISILMTMCIIMFCFRFRLTSR